MFGGNSGGHDSVPFPGSMIGQKLLEVRQQRQPPPTAPEPAPAPVQHVQSASSSKFDEEFGCNLSAADLEHILALTDSFSRSNVVVPQQQGVVHAKPMVSQNRAPLQQRMVQPMMAPVVKPPPVQQDRVQYLESELQRLKTRLIEQSQGRAQMIQKSRFQERQLLEKDGANSLLRTKLRNVEQENRRLLGEFKKRDAEQMESYRVMMERVKRDMETLRNERDAQEQEIYEITRSNKALHKQLAEVQSKGSSMFSSASEPQQLVASPEKMEVLIEPIATEPPVSAQKIPANEEPATRYPSQSELVNSILANAADGGIFELVQSLRTGSQSSIRDNIRDDDSLLKKMKVSSIHDSKSAPSSAEFGMAGSVESCLSYILSDVLPTPCLFPIIQKVIKTDESPKQVLAVIRLLRTFVSTSPECIDALMGSAGNIREYPWENYNAPVPMGYARSPLTRNGSSFVIPKTCCASAQHIRVPLNSSGKRDPPMGNHSTLLKSLFALLARDVVLNPDVMLEILFILLTIILNGHPSVSDMFETFLHSHAMPKLLSPSLASVQCRALATRILSHLCHDRRYLQMLHQQFQGNTVLELMYKCFTGAAAEQGDPRVLDLQLATVDALSSILCLFGSNSAHLLVKKNPNISDEKEHRILARLAMMLASELDRSKENDAPLDAISALLIRDGFLLMDTMLPHTDVHFQIDGTRHIFLSVTTRLASRFHGDPQIVDRAIAMGKELDRYFQKEWI